jgi:hypothetical protein
MKKAGASAFLFRDSRWQTMIIIGFLLRGLIYPGNNPIRQNFKER